jgi:hypothetical protein
MCVPLPFLPFPAPSLPFASLTNRLLPRKSVSCTQDVNAVCPDDRMKVFVLSFPFSSKPFCRLRRIRSQDDDGNTLACIAACFAGINATDPSMNCCVRCLFRPSFLTRLMRSTSIVRYLQFPRRLYLQ